MVKLESMRKFLGTGVLGMALTTPIAWGNFTPEAEFIPGEMIIKLKKGVDVGKFFADKSLGVSSKEQVKLSYGEFYVVKVDTDNAMSSM